MSARIYSMYYEQQENRYVCRAGFHHLVKKPTRRQRVFFAPAQQKQHIQTAERQRTGNEQEGIRRRPVSRGRCCCQRRRHHHHDRRQHQCVCVPGCRRVFARGRDQPTCYEAATPLSNLPPLPKRCRCEQADIITQHNRNEGIASSSPPT